MADPLWLYKLRNGLLGTPDGQGLSEEQTNAAQRAGMMDFGAALLAASGPSRTPVNLGQALGSALATGRQGQQQTIDSQLKAMLLKKQIEGSRANPFGTVSPSDFTPESLAEFQKTGNYGVLKRASGQNIGNYNPGDYTPESFEEFLKTGSPSSLRRYVTPANPTIQLINGVPTVVQPSKTGGGSKVEPLSTLEAEAAADREKAKATAEGKGEGESASTILAKEPAAKSMEYVMRQFDSQIDQTMQGGPMGASGRAGIVFDYGDSVRFDNLREQLSTEIRTVYRIPGEGTLSDREQAQYGLQLPNRNYPPSVNKAILTDLRERTRIRLKQESQPEEKPVRTWEEGGYMYREMPGGVIQRKKK